MNGYAHPKVGLHDAFLQMNQQKKRDSVGKKVGIDSINRIYESVLIKTMMQPGEQGVFYDKINDARVIGNRPFQFGSKLLKQTMRTKGQTDSKTDMMLRNAFSIFIFANMQKRIKNENCP